MFAGLVVRVKRESYPAHGGVEKQNRRISK